MDQEEEEGASGESPKPEAEDETLQGSGGEYSNPDIDLICVM